MNPSEVIIGIGSDHAGYRLKEAIKGHLQDIGYQVRDFGVNSEEPVDYPQQIRPVAQAVAAGDCHLGIVVGGSGNGEAMVANKIRGIRCAVCWNDVSARLAKEHNNANMISIGQRLVTEEMAIEIVGLWLTATFQGGRHERRILQIEPE